MIRRIFGNFSWYRPSALAVGTFRTREDHADHIVGRVGRFKEEQSLLAFAAWAGDKIFCGHGWRSSRSAIAFSSSLGWRMMVPRMASI
jgi:hypothetical protein